MPDIDTTFGYSRTIKLSPAIGDWTTLRPDYDVQDETQISTIQHNGFNSLSKETLKEAHFLHYKLAQDIIKKFSQDMDIKVDLHSITATQLSYRDFLQHYSRDSIQTYLTIKKVGAITLIIDWNLADSIINRLTGGNGTTSQPQDFSDIELSILEAQLDELTPLLSQTWLNIFNANDIAHEFGVGPVIPDKKMALRESISLFSFAMYFGNNELARFTIVYASQTLGRLLLAKATIPNPKPNRVTLEQKTLLKTKTNSKVILGQATVTMKELSELQIGDIIPLDTKLTDPLHLFLGNSTKFYIQPGTSQNRLGAQIIFTNLLKSPKNPLPVPIPIDPLPLLQPTAPPEPTQKEELFDTYEPEPEEEYEDEILDTVTEEEADFEDEIEDSPLDEEEEDTDEDDTNEFDWDTTESEAETPAETPPKSTEDDDLSWDSLDEHF